MYIYNANLFKKYFQFADRILTLNMSSNNNNNKLQIVKLSPYAVLPFKGSPEAAGLDICSAHNYLIKAHDRQLLSTDLQILLPKGTYGRIAPRSGLAIQHFITVGGGVIDRDYRGPIAVILFNHSNVNFQVKRGDRIAQIICEKIIYPEIEVVSSINQTVRGSNGFGSTDDV